MQSNLSHEKILLVDSDADNRDLIARQTLEPLGYKVQAVGMASAGIKEAVKYVPDVIITNLVLPDLSGKDFLVALKSQGIDRPIILIAAEDQVDDVIQAFRLGATDYLSEPIREAEVVSAVEHALEGSRFRRERENLARQLEKTNQELQRRVHELTTIFALGKAVTSVTDQQKLFKTILDGAVNISEADRGWLLTRDDTQKAFVLRAYHNVPQGLAARQGRPLDDGISSLVGLSGEILAIHGPPLKRFKISKLGQSAMVIPVKAQNQVIGLMVMVRKTARPFTRSQQSLLEAVADYAAISLANVRLFRALEERAQKLQAALENAQAPQKQAANKKN